jgi:hypothetical protein
LDLWRSLGRVTIWLDDEGKGFDIFFLLILKVPKLLLCLPPLNHPTETGNG